MRIESISSIKYPDLVPLVPRIAVPMRFLPRFGGYSFILRASSRRFDNSYQKEFTKNPQLLGNGVIKE
jgi:ribosomal protein L17